MIDKVRENRLRRQAKRLGLWLKKSRAKEWQLHDQGGYCILDPYKNVCVWGPDIDLDLDQVEECLANTEAAQRAGGVYYQEGTEARQRGA